MTESALIETQNLNVMTVFAEPGGLDKILKGFEEKVTGIIPDTSTVKGRKEIASLAYKVAQSKTLLDKLGAELTTDWKEKARKVDLSRKYARDFLDDLKERVRQPLTEWEQAEEARVKAEAEAAKYAADYDEAIDDNILFARVRAIERKEAEIARVQAEQKAREQAEKAKVEQIERDKRIAAEAIARAERAAQEAAIDAEMRLERERQEAARQLQAAKDAAEKRRLADLKAIDDRIAEKIKQDEAAALAEAVRVADQEYRFRIFNEILADICRVGINESDAKVVVKAIASNDIRHIKVIF